MIVYSIEKKVNGSALNEIIVNTNNTVYIINQVAAESEEQSSAAEQIKLQHGKYLI